MTRGRSRFRPWMLPAGFPLLVLALAGCPGNNGQSGSNANDSDTPDPVPMVKIYLRGTAPDCTVQDAGGGTAVTAARGTRVVFVNETTSDLFLTFPVEQRLFGVREAVVYAGNQQELTVRADAVPGEHGYETDCTPTSPGPIIIVPPPPPGEGG